MVRIKNSVQSKKSKKKVLKKAKGIQELEVKD